MQAAATGFGESFVDDRVPSQLTVRDGFVNSGEVLVDDSSGAEVEVSDLRVAHLSLRKANVHARSAHLAPGVSSIQLIMKGSTGKQRCVPVSDCLRFSVGINAPPVSDDQNNWLRHTHRAYGRNCENATSRRMPRMTEARSSRFFFRGSWPGLTGSVFFTASRPWRLPSFDEGSFAGGDASQF